VIGKNIIYFDLETQKSFQQVGGHARADKLRISLAVTYSTAASAYRIYLEEDADALIAELSRADLIVGYNLLDFDYRVLTPYTILDPAQWPTLDMMKDVEQALGRRIGLDAIASATLGIGKSADGRQALEWFKEGKLMEIAHYCCVDVKVTRLIHQYGCQHGHLHYHDRNTGQTLSFAVNWK
jgi:DEAD/DEAH box helicase domain-containing protein